MQGFKNVNKLKISTETCVDISFSQVSHNWSHALSNHYVIIILSRNHVAVIKWIAFPCSNVSMSFLILLQNAYSIAKRKILLTKRDNMAAYHSPCISLNCEPIFRLFAEDYNDRKFQPIRMSHVHRSPAVDQSEMELCDGANRLATASLH